MSDGGFGGGEAVEEQAGSLETEANGEYRFLSGAEMEPGAVLAAFPGARFVARARLSGGDGDATAEIWGILIRLPSGGEAAGAAERREVIADDGRRFRAAVLGGGRPAGDPAAIVAAARYWELPPAYVRRLAGSAGAAVDAE